VATRRLAHPARNAVGALDLAGEVLGVCLRFGEGSGQRLRSASVVASAAEERASFIVDAGHVSLASYRVLAARRMDAVILLAEFVSLAEDTTLAANEH
jgi:hypothetical protein